MLTENLLFLLNIRNTILSQFVYLNVMSQSGNGNFKSYQDNIICVFWKFNCLKSGVGYWAVIELELLKTLFGFLINVIELDSNST